MALQNKKRTISEFTQVDEVLSITKTFTLPSDTNDTLVATSENKRALLWNETMGVMRIFNNGSWETVNGGNKKTRLEYINVSKNDLISTNAIGVAEYVNSLPLFSSLPNDFWKVVINETNQVFDVTVNDTTFGVGGETQLTEQDLFEYGKVLTSNKLKNEEFIFFDTNTDQIFTLVDSFKNEDEIVNVLVNGVSLSKTQYQFIPPNKIQILDELETQPTPDYINIISGRVISDSIKKGKFVWGISNSGTAFGTKSWYKDHTPDFPITVDDGILCSVQCDYGGEMLGENYSVSAEPLVNGDIRFRISSLSLNPIGTANISIPYVIV